MQPVYFLLHYINQETGDPAIVGTKTNDDAQRLNDGSWRFPWYNIGMLLKIPLTELLVSVMMKYFLETPVFFELEKIK